MCVEGLLLLTIYSSELFQSFTKSTCFFYMKNKLVKIPVFPPTPSLPVLIVEALPTPAWWSAGLCLHTPVVRAHVPICGPHATPGVVSTLAVESTPGWWQLSFKRREGKRKTHTFFLFISVLFEFSFFFLFFGLAVWHAGS